MAGSDSVKYANIRYVHSSTRQRPTTTLSVQFFGLWGEISRTLEPGCTWNKEPEKHSFNDRSRLGGCFLTGI